MAPTTRSRAAAAKARKSARKPTRSTKARRSARKPARTATKARKSTRATKARKSTRATKARKPTRSHRTHSLGVVLSKLAKDVATDVAHEMTKDLKDPKHIKALSQKLQDISTQMITHAEENMTTGTAGKA
jgi:hypothetical protein